VIAKHKKSGVILLSGDVHFAQFYKAPCTNNLGYRLWEMTSSGLTHTAWSQFWCPTAFLDMITAPVWTASEIFNELNFGIVDIFSDDLISLQIRDDHGRV
jgi:hypothetical protein